MRKNASYGNACFTGYVQYGNQDKNLAACVFGNFGVSPGKKSEIVSIICDYFCVFSFKPSASPHRRRGHRSRSRSPHRRHSRSRSRSRSPHRRRHRSKSKSRSKSPEKSSKKSKKSEKSDKKKEKESENTGISKEELEIKEANELRAKLGLKPLKP